MAGSGEEHGVVALGDSLLSGYGPALGGVSAVSWAGWIAWALPGCLTLHAVNGARTQQVLQDQVPLLKGRFRLAFVCVGANDLDAYDEVRYADGLAEICRSVRRNADIVAVATLPRCLRVPGLSKDESAALTERLNLQVRGVAGSCGAVVVDLEAALSGAWRMAPDGQHPTSLGQLEAARVAAVALDEVGVHFARHLPDPDLVTVPTVDQRAYEASWGGWLRDLWPTDVPTSKGLAGDSRSR